MALQPRDLGLVALPGVALLVVLAGYPFLLSALEVTPDLIRVLSIGRDAAGAAAVGSAAGAGYLAWSDEGAVESPGLVFLAFLLSAGVAAALAGLLVWLLGPENVTVGPAWQFVGGPLARFGVAMGFAGLAGALLGARQGSHDTGGR